VGKFLYAFSQGIKRRSFLRMSNVWAEEAAEKDFVDDRNGEKDPSGAKAHTIFVWLFGTTEVVP
jgi:hypothetical protein